jgi:hypothetical protein
LIMMPMAISMILSDGIFPVTIIIPVQAEHTVLIPPD